MTEINLSKILEHLREELGDLGIALDGDCCGPDTDSSPFKVFCMAGGLSESLKEMGKSPRDQVLMVRVDEDTAKKLDAWVETGAFKSRSEAAALFIREGLKVHARELNELEDALSGVESAKENLKEKAREVFRTGPEPSSETESEDGDASSTED
jgi:Arc/MetJ-type ribon-helix-helix transcriptional regulator